MACITMPCHIPRIAVLWANHCPFEWCLCKSKKQEYNALYQQFFWLWAHIQHKIFLSWYISRSCPIGIFYITFFTIFRIHPFPSSELFFYLQTTESLVLPVVLSGHANSHVVKPKLILLIIMNNNYFRNSKTTPDSSIRHFNQVHGCLLPLFH